MKRNHFYSHIKIIILLLYLATLNAKVHTPIENEENIELTIHGKEWTYYELDDGLIYDDIGKQYDIGDSIQVSIYSRTIMASPGKKNKKYGFRVTINDNEPLQLKYKKEGSDVTSLERPGWSYSKSGIWYFYLPVQENGYKIKIEPLDRKPVVYMRLTSHSIKKKGRFTEIIKTVNHQNRIKIETKRTGDQKKGTITINQSDLVSEEELIDLSIEIDAEDFSSEGDYFEITTQPENFNKTVEFLDQKEYEFEGEIGLVPTNMVKISEDVSKSIIRLLELLEEHEDIQKIYSNFEVE